MNRITSFTVDHDLLAEGIYVSRIDGDITTYDMRTRIPNGGDFMDTTTAHTVEHMFATFVRNSEIKDDVIYFGPMGCRTGFYLLVRNADNAKVLEITKKILADIIAYEGEVFGNTRKECGNYLDLDLAKAKEECPDISKPLKQSRPLNTNHKKSPESPHGFSGVYVILQQFLSLCLLVCLHLHGGRA